MIPEITESRRAFLATIISRWIDLEEEEKITSTIHQL